MPVFTSSIELSDDYPTIEPSLKLNFARSRSLDPRITFTRASVGTYVGRDGLIKTAGEDEARFDHDPLTLESLGLLTEESRSNSLTYSQPTSAASFGSSGTFTYNAATAPNGATEAFRITHNGSSGNSNWRATRSITFGADSMVLSVWAKGDGGNNYFVWSFQGLGGAIVRAGFKLEGDGETSIITNGNGGHTLQIEKYPDGWYRCIIIANTQSSGGTTQFLYTVSAYSEHSSISGGSVLLWGFQLESGAFATSYIPTSGSAVTRAADTAKITGTNFTDFYNNQESTIVCNFTQNAPTSSSVSGNERLYSFRKDSGADTRIDYVTYNAYHPYIAVDGSAVANLSGFTHLYGGLESKTAVRVKENDFAVAFNGTIESTDSSGTWPPTSNNIIEVFIGSQSTNTNNLNGHIKQFSYYTKALPNAQLQSLTQQ